MLRTKALIIAAAGTLAVAGPQYEIPWHTIDAGGGTSSGGAYTLSGTIGQHDAAPTLAGGAFTLDPGFWPGATAGGACNAADVAPPLGLLDLQDIGAFVTAFTAQNPLADLDDNGLFDLTDINTFVSAFLAGCP